MDQAQKDYFYSKKFTLKGRIFYPELFEPKVSKANPQGAPKYSCMFAWDINDVAQSAQTQAVAQFLATGKAKFFPQIPDEHFKKPVKTWGKYQRQDGKPVQAFLEGKHWMNLSANAQFAPQVVDQARQPVLDAAEVYSGRNVLVNFSFWAYQNSGNTGISTNLEAVMLLEGGDREAAGGGVNLDEAFGGFAADMGMSAAAPAAAPQGVAPAPTHVAPAHVAPTNPNGLF